MANPFRVAVAIAKPSDHHPFDREEAWYRLNVALAPLVHARRLILDPISPSTEAAISARVASGCDALHVVAHARGAENGAYASLVLEGRDGRSRPASFQYFVKKLEPWSRSGVVVLQSPLGFDGPFETAAHRLVEHGVAGAATLASATSAAYLSFYEMLAEGATLHAAALRAGPCVRSHAVHPNALVSPSHQAPPANARAPEGASSIAPADASMADSAAIALAEAANALIAQKRLARAFDVFLCHNQADKPRVQVIAGRLIERGILPWLDIWELRPGESWQPMLEEQLERIPSAAIIVGQQGIGNWQQNEIEAIVNEFTRRPRAVVPVFLEGAPASPKIPTFLKNKHWVDFRVTEPDPLDQLVWGITGRR